MNKTSVVKSEAEVDKVQPAKFWEIFRQQDFKTWITSMPKVCETLYFLWEYAVVLKAAEGKRCHNFVFSIIEKTELGRRLQ